MGYHVRIVSKNNRFTHSDFDEIKARLTTQYGFRERLTDTGELDYLFHEAHESALIFFLRRNLDFGQKIQTNTYYLC